MSDSSQDKILLKKKGKGKRDLEDDDDDFEGHTIGSSLQGNLDRSRKKKIIIGVIVALVVIGIALGIALPLTVFKKKDDPYVDPISLKTYNPYLVDESQGSSTHTQQTVVVKIPPKPEPKRNLLGDDQPKPSRPTGLDGKDYKPVDPKKIPIGVNNQLADEVKV